MKERTSVNLGTGPTPQPNRAPARVTLPISGLTCGGGGALSVERALQALPGVIRVYVNPAMEMAYVEYRPAEVTLGRLAEVIEELGYETVRPERQY